VGLVCLLLVCGVEYSVGLWRGGLALGQDNFLLKILAKCLYFDKQDLKLCIKAEN
jgi:hypothetical protein